jgi:hypothetical protein
MEKKIFATLRWVRRANKKGLSGRELGGMMEQGLAMEDTTRCRLHLYLAGHGWGKRYGER